MGRFHPGGGHRLWDAGLYEAIRLIIRVPRTRRLHLSGSRGEALS
jgi:hypothetical protein